MAKKKYTSYKPSKTLWQEEIPSHWQETDLRMIYTENKVKNIGLVERNLLSLSYGKLKRKDIDNATGLVPASFEGYQIIEEGYIILRFTDLQNDKKSLRVGYCPERGIITNAYVGIVPNEDIHSKYFYYQLHFLDTIKYFYNLGGGVRQSLSYKEFKRETLLIPEPEEQIKIAAFLDYKLAKINRFIQKKKQLIKLLNEQKAAIINQAVTKGLDPNAKMKVSGIEWLGMIPEKWRVWKFKYFTKILSGFSPEQVKFLDEGGVDYFKVEQLNNIDNRYRLNESTWRIDDAELKKIHPSNILLIPKRGAAISTNKIAITTDRSVFDTNVMGLKLNSKMVNIDFIALWIKNRNLIEIADTTTIPQINNKHINPLQIALPELDEQQSIIDHIISEVDNIELTISKINQEILLTQEYKTALIAEAVTGKIDVRDFEIPESIEDESFEDLEEELSLAAENEADYQTEEIEE
ncbi:restriction endonuclease subunit S [Algoriphagus lutimaris]|uniref:restriction endonuclease subunit S n=1 Tax=Algoriphagus lutimaris TaxID=613197 RepID=UPI00196B6D24|nr:restriction endonuclease subunit S [Algoriphagus lutimaris]MBN3519711.1 restriction endonuclease subunit S [Algoriphagus lutimaris]